MSLSLLAWAVAIPALSIPTACTTIRPCKADTVLVTVTLDAAAAMADKLTVSVSVAGAAPRTTDLAHAPGQTTGTVEVDFPAGYPQGQSVKVTIVAAAGNATVGSGATDKSLGNGCDTIAVTVTGGGGDGGTGGSSGTGGAAPPDGGPGTGGVSGGDAGTGGTGGVSGGDAGTGGTGGVSGGDAGTGGTGGAGCPTGQNTTCGVCAATATDRAHCGTTCAVCAAGEVCNGACTSAVLPGFSRVPADPTGWQDPGGAALSLAFRDVGYPNAIYECRTGPDASFTLTVPAWGPCDGATGAGRIHTPVPTAAIPEGNYRTEHRYRADSYVSPAIATRYYVHHSLDKVATCPNAAVIADGPHHADVDYFAAAATFSAANPAVFPTATVFPAPSLIPVRTDPIYLRNPFIKIPFVNVIQSSGMATGEGVGLAVSWPSTGGSYIFNERSLRHSWVLNAARTMVLMKRSYVSPKTPARCLQEIWVGHSSPTASYRRHKIACEALVVNVRGNGLCFTTGGAVPVPVAVESPLLNGAGTVTATLNSTVVSGVGTNFVGLANQFIQIPAATGRWYRIAATPVPTATAITITPAYATASAAAQPFRISPTTTYALPTGFAKMHADAHNYATGVTPPKLPSPKTKCETVGCNTGLPWMTYLPP